MLRVIVRSADYNDQANVGGPIHESVKTFDIEAPELERFLSQQAAVPWRTDDIHRYVRRQVVGVEVVVNMVDPR